MSINLRKILIRDIQYNWGSYTNNHTISAAKEVNMIDSKDYDIFKKNFKKRTFDKLDPGDKVFFTIYSKFPRHKFREAYKNAFVKKIENATAVVINPDNMFTRYVYSHTYYELSDKTYAAGNNWHNYIGTLTYTGSGNGITTTAMPYNQTYTFSDPYIYQDTSPDYLVHRDAIQLVKDEIANMDSIRAEELNKLITSTNREDFELAMNMLESQGGVYSQRILRAIRDSFPSVESLRSILKEWYQKNYLNITNKYI